MRRPEGFVAAILLAGPVAAGAAPPPHWAGIPVIEYQGDRSPAQFATLKSAGVQAAGVMAQREGDVPAMAAKDAKLRDAGLGCYVENIATDFYAAYHRWMPDHPVNWHFTQAQKAARADPASLAPFVRSPSLSDPVWLARVEQRLEEHVRVMRPYHPLWYDLADEAGIADLAAFWDFDFSPVSLEAFRAWLRQTYGSLDALNAEWGTHYADWPAVRPWTTREAMRAPPANVAPWADFKAFMDVAFARAVRAGTDAVHRAAPEARAALEGAQVPGWGGYDYSLLAPAVDVMEPYDRDQNMALLLAFNPQALPMVTAFGADNASFHALWRALLDGARAVIVWDAKPPLVDEAARLTQRGVADAKLFALLRGAPGQALAAAAPVYDPVAIVYSPASFRVEWMIENRPHPDAWLHGSSGADAEGVATRTALEGYAETLLHLGVRPRYLTDAELGAGPPAGVRLLILPHQVALSDAELRSLRAFVRDGGTVLADSGIGMTDLHGRARPGPPQAIAVRHVVPEDRAGLKAALAAAHVAPRFVADAADVELRVSRSEGGWLVTVQRDYSDDADPETVILRLPGEMQGTDLIPGTAIRPTRAVTLKLDPVTPALLELRDAGK